MQEFTFYFYMNTFAFSTTKRKPVHVECAGINMKKINMSISFVYDVSIQDNCENAVFTFLPFYKQNITFSTIKEYSMGTTQPIRNNDELTAFRMYYKDIRPNSRNYCLIVMGLNTALRISNLLRLKWDNVYNYTCRYQPISRTQAYRIVKTAAGKTVQDERDEIYLELEL